MPMPYLKDELTNAISRIFAEHTSEDLITLELKVQTQVHRIVNHHLIEQAEMSLDRVAEKIGTSPERVLEILQAKRARRFKKAS